MRALALVLGLVLPAGLVLLPTAACAAQATVTMTWAQLPAAVRRQAPAERLSLVADYAAVDRAHEQVPVYLVNRTAQRVVVGTTDGDPFMLQDVERNGQWVRAEPFVFSDCGNSYYGVAIEAHRALRLYGHFPQGGTPARVRYRLHRQRTEIVSNVGDGTFTEAAVREASVDAMEMETADATSIEAALFATPRLGRLSRLAAFRRLGELPPATASPILVRVLSDPQADPNAIDAAVRSLATADPAALARRVEDALHRGPARLRRMLLEALRFGPDIGNASLAATLRARALDPTEPDLDQILPWLGRTRADDVERLLAAIAEDPAYLPEVRILARFHREQWFGEDLVDVRVVAPGNYSDGHRLPVHMYVELTNTSGPPLDFTYRELGEIFTLYLTESRGRDQVMIPPHPRPQRRAAPTHVVLAPGERRTFPFHLADHFDLPRDRGYPATVWVSAHLPGIHQIGESGAGGISLNVQP